MSSSAHCSPALLTRNTAWQDDTGTHAATLYCCCSIPALLNTVSIGHSIHPSALLGTNLRCMRTLQPHQSLWSGLASQLVAAAG
jgi:hypothetical protein